MQIIHKLDDFLKIIFPNITNENIIEILKDFYSFGSKKPNVYIENGQVIIDLDTNNSKAQLNLFQRAIELCENQKFAPAEKIIKELIQANPTNSEYHRILGQIYSDLGNQEEAIDALIDALRWNPSNGNALMMMGNIFARFKKDMPTALKYYDQAIATKKADHITLANIAYILFEEGKLAKAKNYVGAAFSVNVRYPNSYFIASLIAEKEGDLHAAFNYMTQSVKFASTADTIYQKGIEQLFSFAKQIENDFDGKILFKAYRSKLEELGGVEVDILEDSEITTDAKIEFAEHYKRDKHIVKYKSSFPAIEHLIMHELVHLDFVLQAKQANSNHIFFSTHQNKQNFLNDIKPTIQNLEKLGIQKEMINKFSEGVFNGINLQAYNTPIDIFIEDFLYKKFTKLRPFQFLSLFRLQQIAINSVTDEKVLRLSPTKFVSISKIYSLVNAIQFKDLFGINLIPEYKAIGLEVQTAENFYNYFKNIRDNRKPGQEFDLVRSWAIELDLDDYFELELESKFNAKNNIDDFIAKLQEDPFGLNEEEDPLEKSEMERFQKSQQELGTNMAVVMFMVDALNLFKEKSNEEIKKVAFEIAALGGMGIDPNKQNYIIASIPEKRFSGNQVLAYMYVSWALAIPDKVQILGLPYENEYELAKKMK
jgi:tetratricopeptide (TPR) repeat protein